MVNLFGQMTERVRLAMRKKHDYDACFKGQTGVLTNEGARVLADFARYCGAYSTTTRVSPISRTVDPIASAVAEGRRQAYLYVLKNTRLDAEKILSMMEDAEK